MHHKQLNESKRKPNESTIWQRRFWEHMIRDEDDLRRQMDYLHFNPLKHVFYKNLMTSTDYQSR